MRAARATYGMGVPRDTPWLDDSAGRVMRPYTASGGRTRSAVALDLLSLVTATGYARAVPSARSTRSRCACARAPWPSPSPRWPDSCGCRRWW